MAKKKTKKIVRYRRPLNINVGMIIFALIFVYMSFSVYTYMKRDKVRIYEVQEGSIVTNRSYGGLILRAESVKQADRSGYVNYYIPEGKRASVGTRVYSLDETGSMNAFLKEHSGGEIQLTEDNLSSLKKQLTAFSMAYRDEEFSSVYDTKYTLDAAVMEYMNFNALDNLDSLAGQGGVSFEQVRADEAGVISYVIDSYEDMTASEVSEAVFDRSAYKKATTTSGKLVESGAPVYKVITSDLWSVIFPLSDEAVKLYGDRNSLRVNFPGKNLKLTGDYSMVTGADGKPYGKLDFDKFMVEFEKERFVDFEVLQDQQAGLKIPITSVTEKEFYLVPADYLTTGGDSLEEGFNKVVPNTTDTVKFVPATIYYSKENFYYIEAGEDKDINVGDYIVKPDSTDRYQVLKKEPLQGVYNINKGYAVFKQIEILDSNDEYYTVRKNMPYGLSVYDHIVLEAFTVQEGQPIYQ